MSWMCPSEKPLRKHPVIIVNLLPWIPSLLVLSMVACSTATKKEVNSTNGAFQSQTLSSVLYVDRAGKSYKLKAEMALTPEDDVRIDVTTLLDLPLASIVLTPKKIEYVIYRDKKFFSGSPNPHALDPVFPLAVNAHALSMIVRGLPPDGDACLNGDGFKQCRGLAGGDTPYVVTWSKWRSSGPMAGMPTKMELELPDRRVALRFYFSDRQTVADAGHLMHVKVPDGFKSLNVPQ